jgi:hypothetical protein
MTPDEAHTIIRNLKSILLVNLRNKCQFLNSSWSGSTLSPPCLHYVIQGSYEDIPDSCWSNFQKVDKFYNLAKLEKFCKLCQS